MGARFCTVCLEKGYKTVSQEQKIDTKLEYNRNSQFRYLSQYRVIIIGHPTGMKKKVKNTISLCGDSDPT